MLTMVMLGGNHEKAKIEQHDVVFIDTDNIHQEYERLRHFWFGDKNRVHIDCWLVVDGIESFKIELTEVKIKKSRNLYFVNLGGYIPNIFGEEHRNYLVVAESQEAAKEKAKQQVAENWHKLHKDNIFNVDDCLLIDSVDGKYVNLIEDHHTGTSYYQEHIIL